MKKIILLVTFFLSLVYYVSFGQSKTRADSNLKKKIIALEKEAWEAWKNKDSDWFRKNATDECLWVTPAGVSNKADWIKTGASACDVTTYLLDNFQLVRLNEKSVVITYTAIVDAICGNCTLPNKMRASVSYVNRNGKWLEAFYMEMPIQN